MHFISENISWIIIAGIISIFIGIIFLVLGLISRGALIDLISNHLQGKVSSFKAGFKTGKKYFWKLFLISLIIGLFLFAAIIILSLPVVILFTNHNFIVGTIMAIFAFIIALPLIILACYLKIYGYIYSVLGQLNFWSAIEKAYLLFQKNIPASIIMGLLFIPLGLILAIIIFIFFIPIAIFFSIIGLILFLIAGKIGAIIALIIGLVFFIIILLAIRSFYEVFSQAVWVLFFNEIAKNPTPEIITEPVVEIKSDAKSLPIVEIKLTKEED